MNTYILPQKYAILGVGVSPVNMQLAISVLNQWISNKSQNYICVAPAHSIMHGYRYPRLRKIFNSSGMTTPDGMAVVWLLQLKGFHNVERVYGPDLMRAVCQRSLQTGWKHYFYGGEPSVGELLSLNLRDQFPGLNITGSYSPPFRELTPDEDNQIIDRINRARPDIVWVGIGSPKQELWMSDHMGKLIAPVLIGVGAAFDFLSGKKRQAPRWIQRSGFEWLFRLASEPKRLWRRYAEYPLFTLLVLLQLLHIKHYPTD